MPDQNASAERHAQVEMEAVAWITRMNGRPSRRERTDFKTWLNRDPLHLQVFDRVHAMWSSTSVSGLDVAREHDAQLSRHLETLQRLRKSKRSVAATGIVVGGLAMLLGSGWVWLERPNLFQDLTADYSTGRGERRTVVLNDGSSVLMDADSALDVDLSETERTVHLIRGNAYFDVSHSQVPFKVTAENGQSQVLGTAFDISIGEEDVSVTLARGSLRVSVGSEAGSVILKPGETVSYDAANVGNVRQADLDATMAWHEGRFVFNDMPLIDVLNTIGRYRSGRIVVIGQQFAQRRVSGSFSLDDPDAALAAVQSTVGFTVDKVAGALVVVRP